MWHSEGINVLIFSGLALSSVFKVTVPVTSQQEFIRFSSAMTRRDELERHEWGQHWHQNHIVLAILEMLSIPVCETVVDTTVVKSCMKKTAMLKSYYTVKCACLVSGIDLLSIETYRLIFPPKLINKKLRVAIYKYNILVLSVLLAFPNTY